MRIIGMVVLLFCGVFVSTGLGGEERTGKILVIYYSLSGNTRALAEKIAEKTGADIFVLETERPYSMSSIGEETKREVATGNWPVLKGDPPDMREYDCALVGGPVWSHTVSSPVRSLLKQMDFQGKMVAPFLTCGSVTGNYFADFRNNATNALVLDGLECVGSVSGNPAFAGRIDAWLADIGVGRRALDEIAK